MSENKKDIEKVNDGDVLAEEIGLNVYTDKITGAKRLITPKGVIPSDEAVADVYYERLIKRIVSQEIMSIRPIASFTKFVKDVDAVNGLREYFLVGLSVIKEYTKTIVIADWNPTDPFNKSYIGSITIKDETTIKIDVLSIVSAFVSGATLNAFTNEIVSTKTNSLDIKYQNEIAYLYANLLYLETGYDASLEYVYDKKVDVDTLTNVGDGVYEKALNDLKRTIDGLETKTPTHLAISRNEDNLINSLDPQITIDDLLQIQYSATKKNLAIIWDVNFKADIQTSVLAKVFGPDYFDNGLEEASVNFEALGITGVDKPLILLIDVDAFKHLVQINRTAWSYDAPHAQKISELHWWRSYFKRKDRFVGVWYSATGVYSLNKTSTKTRLIAEKKALLAKNKK